MKRNFVTFRQNKLFSNCFHGKALLNPLLPNVLLTRTKGVERPSPLLTQERQAVLKQALVRGFAVIQKC